LYSILTGIVLRRCNRRPSARIGHQSYRNALAGQICGSRGCDDIVVLGRAADLIGAIARDVGVQLIVMGLASDRGVFAPRPGSIAYRVLCSTSVPVLVVPTSDK
jgi:hypothetical protein